METLDREARAVLEAALAGRLAAILPADAVVGAYVPVGAEVDPRAGLGPHALPFFADPGAPMRFRLGPPLAPGAFGVPEPAADAPEVNPAILIVPMLAATPSGARLGQGGGHYDRYLAAAPGPRPLVIAAGWDLQLAPFLPTEPHDMPVDYIVTPSALIRCAP